MSFLLYFRVFVSRLPFPRSSMFVSSSRQSTQNSQLSTTKYTCQFDNRQTMKNNQQRARLQEDVSANRHKNKNEEQKKKKKSRGKDERRRENRQNEEMNAGMK